jgi:glycine cleavage system H lipoate-binding protein
MDDFSRRLLGSADDVKVPAVGTWVGQGSTGARVGAHHRFAELLSPVEGEVVAVNTDLKRDPTLATRDPYGHGWLYKVRPAHLASNLRNLLSGRLARRWTEDAREQLDVRLMALSGSVLQDGGEPAPDFAAHLELEDWKDLVETFLLTEGRGA